MAKILLTWWFDTEDFVTPQSDNPPLWVAEFFRKNGYKATFKMVGEKVRVLSERHREDVIHAVGAHDVGFHTNLHSKHPNMYDYLKGKSWEEGCREFERRELYGLKLLQRKFGRVVCFGHPGPAWAAEAYPALLKWNVPVYLDSSSILMLNGKPYWYCNILNLQVSERYFIRIDKALQNSKSLQRAKMNYRRICSRLKTEGPGISSMLLHPHTTVTREYWDSLNFAAGRNRRKYRTPPLRTASDIEGRLKRFQAFVNYTASQPNTKMINATEAAKIYEDRARYHLFRPRDLSQIASQIRNRLTFVKCKDFYISPAEIFWLIATAIAGYQQRGVAPNNLRLIPIFGPSLRATRSGPKVVPVSKILQSSITVSNLMKHEKKIPDAVKVDSTVITPSDYLTTSSKILLRLLARQSLPKMVEIDKTHLDCEKYVSIKSFNRAFKWYVLKPGYKSPTLIEHAKLQTWTLKPAIPRAE